MSIVSIVEIAFAGLVSLLKLEASKHAKAAAHHHNKAYNHRAAEDKAIKNMKAAGGIYRTSLYNKGDEHQRAADKARALAAKIGSII